MSSPRGARRWRARKQADTWGGLDPDTRPFFHALVDEYDASRHRRPRAARPARSAGRRARPRRTRRSAAFLVEEYAPRRRRARPGRARALRALRAGLQRHRARPRRDLRLGLGRAAPHRARDARRSPSASCPAQPSTTVIEHLETDPTRAIEGVDEFQRWNQDLHRPHDRRAQRHALRHPRAGAARARR